MNNIYKDIIENPDVYLEKYRDRLSKSQIIKMEELSKRFGKKRESKEIDEVTSTASVGGSFEVPFKVKKQFESGSVSLTSEQMAQLTIDLLLEEYVYSNPDNNYKNLGKENAKNAKEDRNKIEDVTKANVKLEQDNTNDNRNELEDSTKENIETKDADAIKKRHKDNFASPEEIERRNIERQKGGMQMTKFDHISDAAKEFQENEFKRGDKAISKGNGSAALDTELGKDLLDNAKKIRDGAQITPTISLGDDIEVNPNIKLRKKVSLGERKIYKVDTVIGNNKRTLFEIAKNIEDEQFIIQDNSNDQFHLHKENGRNTLTYVLNERKIEKANSRINKLFGYVSPNTKNSKINETKKFIKSYRNGSKT